MFLLYLDEFGHDGIWDPADPRHNHHPIFGLGGVVVHKTRAADFDRGYLRLKQSYFKNEIARELVTRGTRAERFEWKSLANRRDMRFTADVLALLGRVRGRVFAQGVAKWVGNKYKPDAVYGSTTQAMMRAFEKFLKNAGRDPCGVMVMDRRNEDRDVEVSGSAQSHLFSGDFKRLIEIPFLVRSEWHHGVQAADTIARALGKVFRYRATGEKRLRKFEVAFGSTIDSLAEKIGPWSSVHVRNLPPPLPPPKAASGG